MGSEHLQEQGGTGEQPTTAQFTGEADAGEGGAWEQVAAGRYMPRRIKGSCVGRALG